MITFVVTVVVLDYSATYSIKADYTCSRYIIAIVFTSTQHNCKTRFMCPLKLSLNLFKPVLIKPSLFKLGLVKPSLNQVFAYHLKTRFSKLGLTLNLVYFLEICYLVSAYGSKLLGFIYNHNNNYTLI